MKKLLIILSLLLPITSFAQTEAVWQLDENLQVSPPEFLDLTHQVLEDFDPEEKVIIGWHEDDSKYAIIIDKQPGGHEVEEYWTGLESQLAQSSDNGELSIIKAGEIAGDHIETITYKIVTWQQDGETATQILGLLVGKKHAYYFLVSLWDEDDLILAANESITVMKTAKIIE